MPRPARRARGRVLPALACLLVVGGDGAGPAPPVAPASAALPAPRAQPRPPAAPQAPTWLDLPAVGTHAPVRPVTVTGAGALGVPDDPAVVGWWAAGGRVGERGGALVLDGHIDSAVAGPGALFRLAALAPGDAVLLTTADGIRHAWTVEVVRAYPKAALPAAIFAPADPPALVIVSCGGHFDRRTGQYADNVVAIAHPA